MVTSVEMPRPHIYTSNTCVYLRSVDLLTLLNEKLCQECVFNMLYASDSSKGVCLYIVQEVIHGTHAG